MTQGRKFQFWLDNKSGTLTEYSADLNQVQLKRAVDILENTHINEDDKSVMGNGLRSATIPLNGYMNDATTSIVDVLDRSQGTTVSKTFQVKFGVRYWNGECFPGGIDPGGDGKKLSLWSCTLEVDGAVNRTTVALT